MKVFIPGNFHDYGNLFNSDSTYTVKEREDLFKLLPENIKINSILELGCADGKNLIFFKKKLGVSSENVVGVDICSNLTEENNNFKFYHQNAEKFFEINNSDFDLILFSDVIEHIFNPWKILSKSRVSLSKNGLCLLSVPNLQNLHYLNSIIGGNFFYNKTGLFDETHIRFFTLNSLKVYLEQLNYKIINTGWRADKSLQPLRERLLAELENKKEVYMESGDIKIKINIENINNYFSQQILICFSL